jgi:hypothetical protein
MIERPDMSDEKKFTTKEHGVCRYKSFFPPWNSVHLSKQKFVGFFLDTVIAYQWF